jgi:hypothetical protein
MPRGGAGIFLNEMACDDVGETQLTEDRLALRNTISQKLEAIGSSATLVPVNQNTGCHIT